MAPRKIVVGVQKTFSISKRSKEQKDRRNMDVKQNCEEQDNLTEEFFKAMEEAGLPSFEELRRQQEAQEAQRKKVMDKCDAQVVFFDRPKKNYTSKQFEEEFKTPFKTHIARLKDLCIWNFSGTCKDFLIYEEDILSHIKYNEKKSQTDLATIKSVVFNSLVWCKEKAHKYCKDLKLSKVKTLTELDEKVNILHNKLFSDLLKRVLLHELDDACYCESYLTELFTVDFRNIEVYS